MHCDNVDEDLVLIVAGVLAARYPWLEKLAFHWWGWTPPSFRCLQFLPKHLKELSVDTRFAKQLSFEKFDRFIKLEALCINCFLKEPRPHEGSIQIAGDVRLPCLKLLAVGYLEQ